jgi:hypothetical protein
LISGASGADVISASDVLFGALAAVARAMGYRGSYPKYSGASEPSCGERVGPQSTTGVVAGAFAAAASLILASFSVRRRTRRPPTFQR